MAARGVLRAAARVSKFLADREVPHALVGGLAVGAHGFNRTTDNVDFVVPAAAHSLISALGEASPTTGHLPGLSIKRGGVVVGFRFVAKPLKRSDLSSPVWFGRLPVVSLDALVALKVSSERLKDVADIVELLKLGTVDVPAVLARLSSDHLARFRDLVTVADLEQHGRNREGRRVLLAVLARCAAQAATSGR